MVRFIKPNPAPSREIQAGFLALKKNGEYDAYCQRKEIACLICNQQTEPISHSNSIYQFISIS